MSKEAECSRVFAPVAKASGGICTAFDLDVHAAGVEELFDGFFEPLGAREEG